MPKSYSARVLQLGATLLIAGAAGCTDFLTVPNPTVIDAGALNPTIDAATRAASAQQNFATSHGLMAMYSSWFTGETQVSETFPTRNEFGTRGVVPTNGSLNADVWVPLSQTLSEARFVLGLSLPTPATNLVRAQAALFSAFAFMNMATDFCGGAVGGGPLIITPALLDSAIANFNIAITIGRAAATAPGATAAIIALGDSYRRAGFVGLARAQLQKSDASGASTSADSVPAGFVFNLNYVDDLSNRGRLSNTMYQFTRDRGSIMVAPAYRTTDTRVPYALGSTLGFTAPDASSGTYYVQTKFAGYAIPIRLASRLEADYIKQEVAGTPGPAGTMVAFINARRTAGGQPAYGGATDAASLQTELMNQKAFDFYLEGKRLADFRRIPASVTNVPVPGSAYFKAGFGNVASRTCYPIPTAETDANPNHPSTP